MATDLLPSTTGCDRDQKEAERFALNKNSKVVVRVEDEEAIEILNDILTELGGSAGTPFFSEVQTTLISEVVPASTTRKLSKVVVSCRKAGKFNIKINSTIVGSGRIGPGKLNAEFRFSPVRSAVATDTIVVEFEQFIGTTTAVEAYLMATDV